jgi:hypothetical protein
MKHAALVAALAAALTVTAGGAETAPPVITPAAVAALRSWVDAVKTHAPGHPDASVLAVSAYSFKTREDLNTGMGLFLTVLMSRVYDTERNQAARVVADIAHAAGNPDAAAFLKQAAVLHSDAAAYVDLNGIPPAAALDVPPPSRAEEMKFDPARGMPMNIPRNVQDPPLLTRNRIVLNKDGQVLGEAVASWHWPFARSLLDLIPTRSAGSGAASTGKDAGAALQPRGPVVDPFVGAWYHATTAYMFARGLYGDATPHLQRAAELLPDDARVLVDRATYAEIQGLPMFQVLRPGAETAGERPSSGLSRWTIPGSGATLRVADPDKTNAEAERLFRRALKIDPSHAEARVRLARLLILRKRYQAAAAELTAALAANPAGVVAYEACLFAGRAAQSLGKIDEAAGHYRDALALFPDAQSALVAQSQLALFRSDVPGALAPIQRLGARSGVFTADPWWQYHLAAGRDADALLGAVWESVPRSR